MTEVFSLREHEWLAIWNGKLARATFNSKGAALAWIATCNKAGKYRR